MHTILVVVQVLVAVSLIGLILIQHGKGADAGAAFGSGASGTVFGARGAANFMTRLTAILATAFFVASLTLAYLVSDRSPQSNSVVDSVAPAMVTEEEEVAPAEAVQTVPGAAMESSSGETESSATAEVGSDDPATEASPTIPE